MSYQAVLVIRLRLAKITNKVRLQHYHVTWANNLLKRIPVPSTVILRIEFQ